MRWMTSATFLACRTRTVSADGLARSLTRSPAAPLLSDALNVAKRASERGFAAAGAVDRASSDAASTAVARQRFTAGLPLVDGLPGKVYRTTEIRGFRSVTA